MNWADYAVIAIIVGFGIVGLVKGFIFSVYRLASFFISILISVKYYPVIADLLMKTAFFTSIKGSILKSLMKQIPGANTQAKSAAADSILNNLHLPGFLKADILSKLPDPSKIPDVSKVMDVISTELAKNVISVISLALLFIAISIALALFGVALKGIAKLPLFRQIDRLGGLALGAVEGLLFIYLLFAVAMLFHASPQFMPFFKAVEESALAKFFYQNNFIVNWMFSKGSPI